jgi:Domain of unknown function (DUF1707)
MDDRIRVSDADRERVTARLREHFAEGRLSQEELDERLSAALSAKTAGDLRRLMADLPGIAPVPAQAGSPGPWAAGRGLAFRRGPRLWPLAVFALIATLVLPGAGWLLFAFFQFVLALFLVASLAGVFAVARFRRNMRRYWQSGEGASWRQYQWRQYQWH